MLDRQSMLPEGFQTFADATTLSYPFLVAVHCGAGSHAPAKEGLYRQAMAAACKAAAAVLARGGTSEAGVAAAIRVLEDSPVTNAGTGSSLNLAGAVECDAALMAGNGRFGAVGAVAGVQNPILVAAALAQDSGVPLSCGRVRPMLLVGDGARSYAHASGMAAVAPGLSVPSGFQVTPAALAAWMRYTEMIRLAATTTTQQQTAISTAAVAPLELSVAGAPPSLAVLEAPPPSVAATSMRMSSTAFAHAARDPGVPPPPPHSLNGQQLCGTDAANTATIVAAIATAAVAHSQPGSPLGVEEARFRRLFAVPETDIAVPSRRSHKTTGGSLSPPPPAASRDHLPSCYSTSADLPQQPNETDLFRDLCQKTDEDLPGFSAYKTEDWPKSKRSRHLSSVDGTTTPAGAAVAVAADAVGDPAAAVVGSSSGATGSRETDRVHGTGTAAHNQNDEVDETIYDTVGAICVDYRGRVAAGVSSGGIAVKFPGRVGEAAMYGSGCWARDPWVCDACIHAAAGGSAASRPPPHLLALIPPRPPRHLLPPPPAVACQNPSSSHCRTAAAAAATSSRCRCLSGFAASVTGVGEAIIRADLARQCAATAATAATAEARSSNSSTTSRGTGGSYAAAAAATESEDVGESAAKGEDGGGEDDVLVNNNGISAALLDGLLEEVIVQRLVECQPSPREGGVLATRVTVRAVETQGPEQHPLAAEDECGLAPLAAAPPIVHASPAAGAELGPIAVEVELAAVHCAMSMAVAHMSHMENDKKVTPTATVAAVLAAHPQWSFLRRPGPPAGTPGMGQGPGSGSPTVRMSLGVRWMVDPDVLAAPDTTSAEGGVPIGRC